MPPLSTLSTSTSTYHINGQVGLGCLQYADNMKVKKYGPTCNSLGREFLPLGFTLWGKMSSGTREFLRKVANAAHEHG